MDNCEHKSILLDTLSDLLNKIDVIPCHPKNKLLLYHRYTLSKLSWHLTIADLNKTWVVENLDSAVTRYIPGADPERNLTRAQPKSRGCGYMGAAIGMGSYKHDLADAAQLSA